MRSTSHLTARMIALVASLAAVTVLVALPCPMGAEACALSPVAPTGATSARATCPMAAANGGRPMECCAKGESPHPANPATPAGPDSGSRLQLKVLPVGADMAPATIPAPAATEHPATARATTHSAPATPLYTLLSTLLS